jgi:hypothetical protein
MRIAFAPAFAIAAVFHALSPQASSATEAGFGLSYAAQAARPRAASEAWQARVARGRMDYETFAARAVQKYLFLAPRPHERRAAGKTDTSIMQDPTLRAGDIFAATDGFLVFRGRTSPSHLPTDFAPMPQATARDLSLAIDSPTGAKRP